MFIVHGRADGPPEAVARFVARFGLRPIILPEPASEDRTIIEKIARHSRIGYVVVLLTSDDRGGLAVSDPATYQPAGASECCLSNSVTSLGSWGDGTFACSTSPGWKSPLTTTVWSA